MLQELSDFFKLLQKRHIENFARLADTSLDIDSLSRKKIILFLKKYNNNWESFFDKVKKELVDEIKSNTISNKNAIYCYMTDEIYIKSEEDRNLFYNIDLSKNSTDEKDKILTYIKNDNIYKNLNLTFKTKTYFGGNGEHGLYLLLINRLIPENKDRIILNELIKKIAIEDNDFLTGVNIDPIERSEYRIDIMNYLSLNTCFLDLNIDLLKSLINKEKEKFINNGIIFHRTSRYRSGSFVNEDVPLEQKKKVFDNVILEELVKFCRGEKIVEKSFINEDEKIRNLEIDFQLAFKRFVKEMINTEVDLLKEQIFDWVSTENPYIKNYLNAEKDLSILNNKRGMQLPNFLLTKIPYFTEAEKALFSICLMLLEKSQDDVNHFVRMIIDDNGNLSHKAIMKTIIRNDSFFQIINELLAHQPKIIKNIFNLAEMFKERKKHLCEENFYGILSKSSLDELILVNQKLNNFEYYNDSLIIPESIIKDNGNNNLFLKRMKKLENDTLGNGMCVDSRISLKNLLMNDIYQSYNNNEVPLINLLTNNFGVELLLTFNLHESSKYESIHSRYKKKQNLSYIYNSFITENKNNFITFLILNGYEQATKDFLNILEKNNMLDMLIDKYYLKNRHIVIISDEEHAKLPEELKAQSRDTKKIFNCSLFSLALLALSSKDLIDFIANKTGVVKNNELGELFVFDFLKNGTPYNKDKKISSQFMNRLSYAFKKYNTSYDMACEFLIPFANANNRTKKMALEMFHLPSQSMVSFFKEREMKEAIENMNIEKIKELKSEGFTLDYQISEGREFKGSLINAIEKKIENNPGNRIDIYGDLALISIIDWVFSQDEEKNYEEEEFTQKNNIKNIADIEKLLDIFLETEEDKKCIKNLKSKKGNFLDYIVNAYTLPHAFLKYIEMALDNGLRIDNKSENVANEENLLTIDYVKMPYLRDVIKYDIININNKLINKNLKIEHNQKKVKRL